MKNNFIILGTLIFAIVVNWFLYLGAINIVENIVQEQTEKHLVEIYDIAHENCMKATVGTYSERYNACQMPGYKLERTK